MVEQFVLGIQESGAIRESAAIRGRNGFAARRAGAICRAAPEGPGGRTKQEFEASGEFWPGPQSERSHGMAARLVADYLSGLHHGAGGGHVFDLATARNPPPKIEPQMNTDGHR